MADRDLGERAVRFVRNLSEGGPDESLITTDFEWWMSFRPGTMNAAEVREHIAHINLPPVEKEILGVAAGPDRVAVEVQGRCTLADGRQYDNNYCFIMVFRGDLIREVREYCDTKLAADIFGGLGEAYQPERV